MRKTLALLLCVTMLLSFAVAVNEAHAAGLSNFTATNEYDGRFLDVSASDWFYESVALSYELGLVKGKSETAFSPSGEMTVAEAIALACRIHSIYNTGKAEFEQGAPWYDVYLNYAAANGWISGSADILIVGTSELSATESIRRADFAFLFSKALPESEFAAINTIEDGAIPDVAPGIYFTDAVYQFYRAGVLTGNDTYGTFAPYSSIRRSEVSTIATRMVDPSLRKTVEFEKKATESNLYCYPYTDVPDFGVVVRVSAHSNKRFDDLIRYLYSSEAVLDSRYGKDFVNLYAAELEKHGYIYQGFALSEDERTFLVYRNGERGVMIGTLLSEDGTEYISVVYGPYESLLE